MLIDIYRDVLTGFLYFYYVFSITINNLAFILRNTQEKHLRFECSLDQQLQSPHFYWLDWCFQPPYPSAAPARGWSWTGSSWRWWTSPGTPSASPVRSALSHWERNASSRTTKCSAARTSSGSTAPSAPAAGRGSHPAPWCGELKTTSIMWTASCASSAAGSWTPGTSSIWWRTKNYFASKITTVLKPKVCWCKSSPADL